MIFFDITKTGAVRHRSGLARLSERLREEMEGALAVSWTEAQTRAGAGDWFVTGELFSEAERPGFAEFISSGRCRTAAIFADAIPMKLPHITWPQSVARHPHYLKLLARFERVWAISEASRVELVDYWRWLELDRTPPVEVLPLGADMGRSPRRTVLPTAAVGTKLLLCVGIIEPRKNQTFLLDVAEQLWAEGVDFELHLVGRVNPHFGRPIATRIKALARRERRLIYHEAASDEVLAGLYARAHATVCPTIAEGCGLPLLESLWQGVPCVCSDLPVLRENADGGGCVPVPMSDQAAWATTMKQLLVDGAFHAQLAREATSRGLPTWSEAAGRLAEGLR